MALFHTGALAESMQTAAQESGEGDSDYSTFVAPGSTSSRIRSGLSKGGGKNRATVEMTTGQCEYECHHTKWYKRFQISAAIFIVYSPTHKGMSILCNCYR